MFQFSQSPFLQALGYTIVNSLWQSATLWLIYLAVNCVANISSHKKYAAAVSLQLAGFAWFLITVIFYYKRCTYLADTGSVLNDGLVSFGQMPYTGSIKDRILLGILSTEAFLPYLSLAYIIIFFFLVLRWVEAFRNTRSLKLSGLEKIDVQFRLFVEKLSHQLGIKRSVSVFLSHHVKSPLTVGFLKPIILIPFASLNNLSCEQVEAVLLHELAHIKRSDYLINLILSVIEVVLFFNPFVQLISRHIKRERENSCDDWVLQFEYNASNYAKALLVLATLGKSTSNSLTMNAVDQKHSLLLRVKRIIEKKDRTFIYRNQLITLLGLAILMSFMAWITPRSKHQNVTSAAFSNQLVVPEPMASKIDNPFFNPLFFLAEKENLDATTQKEHFRNEVGAFPALKNFDFIATGKNLEQPTLDKESLLGNYDKEAEVDTILTNPRVEESPISVLFEESTENSPFQLKPEIISNKNVTAKNINAAIRQELKKAIEKVKTSLAFANEENKLHAIEQLQFLQDSLEIHFQKIQEIKALRVVINQLENQLKIVSLTGYGPASNNWKHIESYETIISTLNGAPAHVFSYDYTDKPQPAASAQIAIPAITQTNNMLFTPDDFLEITVEVLEVQLNKRSNKVVRKIIKRTRI